MASTSPIEKSCFSKSSLSSFRPVLMWFWNSFLDKAQIRRMLRDFKKKGFHDICIHAAYGLEISYLSEEYLSAVNEAISEAKRLGIRIWIYDEYAWPSGTAGGIVLRDHPEHRMSTLLAYRLDVPPFDKVEIPHKSVPLVVRVVLWKGLPEKDEPWDVLMLGAEQKYWENATAGWASLLVFEVTTTGGIHPASKWRVDAWEQEGSLNYCSSAAVEKFISATYETYFAKFGKEFGSTVVGFFTDEPLLCSGWVLQGYSPFTGFPWYESLPEDFHKKYGYSIIEHLHELGVCTGNYIKTRNDYWAHLASVFSKTYCRKLATWCAEHSVFLTGHLNAEEDLLATMLTSGNWYESAKYFHIPGIDNLLSSQQVETDEAVLPAKQVSSLANQMSKPFTLCETFSGSGWDLNFLQMKRVIDHLAVLGINKFLFMGSYYSIKGFRKYPPDASWPPSHGEQNSLWEYYSLFSSYIARVCKAISYGKYAAKIGVLYPIQTAWTLYQFDHVSKLTSSRQYRRLWECIRNTYLTITNALLEVQADYEVIFPDFLNSSVLEENCLCCGGRRFSVLILPSCFTLSAELYVLLKNFVTRGGILLFINGLPTQLCDGTDIRAEVTRLWNMDVDATNALVMEVVDGKPAVTLPADILSLSAKTPNVRHLATNCFSKETRHIFRSALVKNIPKDARQIIEPESSLVRICTRKRGNVVQYYVVNTGNKSYNGSLVFPWLSKAVGLDPETGKKFPLKVTHVDGTRRIPLTLPPYGSAIIRLEEKHPKEFFYFDHSKRALITEVVLADGWRVLPAGPNVLPLDVFVLRDGKFDPTDLKIEDILKRDFVSVSDGRFIQKTPPILGKGNGWGVMDGEFPLTSFEPGSSYWLRASFFLEEKLDKLWLITEDLGIKKVMINGHFLKPVPTRVWDVNDLKVRVDEVVHKGINHLFMLVTIPNWKAPHALPYVAILGNFVVSDSNRISPFSGLMTLGDWTKQGYPFYSGSMIYQNEFWVDAFPATYTKTVELSLDCAGMDVVTVYCNGKSKGTRLWPPYVFRFAVNLINGKNSLLVKVTNPTANRYRFMPWATPECLTGQVNNLRDYQPIPAGITGSVRLRFFE